MCSGESRRLRGPRASAGSWRGSGAPGRGAAGEVPRLPSCGGEVQGPPTASGEVGVRARAEWTSDLRRPASVEAAAQVLRGAAAAKGWGGGGGRGRRPGPPGLPGPSVVSKPARRPKRRWRWRSERPQAARGRAARSGRASDTRTRLGAQANGTGAGVGTERLRTLHIKTHAPVGRGGGRTPYNPHY